MPTGLTILGKSDVTIAVILDILESRALFSDIDVVNNLDIPIEHTFQNDWFNVRIVKEIIDETSKFAVGVTSAPAKQALLKNIDVDKFNWVKLVHASAVLASTIDVGIGSMVGALTTIGPHTSIGRFVSINRGVNIGHHCILNDFVTISPGCNIAGHVNIGEGSTIGIGANIVHKINIGKNSVIGAGSVVTRDIPDNVIAFGSPCKIIKPNG